MSKLLQRESNIELLRLVVMSFIVLHHFIFHGLGQYRYLAFNEPPFLSPEHINLALIIDAFLIAAVDVFILISGWFSIKLKAASFVKLFCMVSFFAMLGFISYLGKNGLVGGVIGSILRVIQRGIFVVSNKTYWFIQYYFILMILSGPINKLCDALTRDSLRITIGILLFINVYLGWIRDVAFVTDGYNLTNFIMFYLIGRYLKLHYHKSIDKRFDVIIFTVSSLATAFLALTLHHFELDTYRAYCYNSPFVIVSAVALFMLFTKIQFKSAVINYLAASCLAIYLMQEGGVNCYSQIRDLYIGYGFSSAFGGYVLLLFFLSMLIPLLVDKFRLLLFKRLESKVAQVVDKLIFQKMVE